MHTYTCCCTLSSPCDVLSVSLSDATLPSRSFDSLRSDPGDRGEPSDWSSEVASSPVLLRWRGPESRMSQIMNDVWVVDWLLFSLLEVSPDGLVCSILTLAVKAK